MDTLNESVIRTTKHCKMLKAEITSYLDGVCETDIPDTIKDSILYARYNDKLLSTAITALKRRFKPCYISNPYSTSIAIKGVKLEKWFFDMVAFHDGKLYSMKFTINPRSCRLLLVNEVLLDKIKIPKDVIEYAISIANPDFSFVVGKNNITTILRGSGNRENAAFVTKVIGYTNRKHKDINAVKKGIGIKNTILFK